MSGFRRTKGGSRAMDATSRAVSGLRALRAGFLGTIALAVVAAGCAAAEPAPTPKATARRSSPDRHTVAGTSEARTLTIGGRERAYSLYRPPAAPAVAPLVVSLHMLTASDLGSARSLLYAAEREGFLLALPQGVDFSWNAGTCCGAAAAAGVDDVAFLDALISEIRARDGAGDAFVVGFSNGGFMAYRLACEGTAPLSGIAVVEGAVGVEPCMHARALDALFVHQTGDDVVPYAGASAPRAPGEPGPFPGVDDGFAAWLEAADCGTARTRRTARDVTSRTARCTGGGRARLVRIEGGSHHWPVAPGDPVDATAAAVSFFGLDGDDRVEP